MRKTLGDILLFFLFGTIALLALFALLSLGRGGTQRTSTLERVLQPQASVQLEAQQLAAEAQQAQMDAERTERRDWLVFVGALALAGMGVLVLIAWLVSRRPQEITYTLPAYTPPHLIDAQWRVIDAQMARNGYELEDAQRGK
jgi:hypothetical protein